MNRTILNHIPVILTSVGNSMGCEDRALAVFGILLRHTAILTMLSISLSLAGFDAEAADPKMPPPAPLAPIPTPRQLAWHQREQYAFIHFGINTFTDREWGDGKEDPQLFNPTDLDARQWARVCQEAGFKMIVLTCKHHDGFCLWPSQYTEHSVKNSPWRGGKGDVVREVANACREFGLNFGVYLSPWDRHEPSYGDSPRYNEHYKKQLTELLTNYGQIATVWFDGACGEGPNGRRQVYDWDGYIALVRQLQPMATVFSDAGPDVRWVGNESGLANETNWAMYNRSKVKVGGGVLDQMGSGDPTGPDWVPAECDVSIRPGWFHHDKENDQVKSLEHLLDIYYRSVGQNSCLHLNLPPDCRGLIHENDVARLRQFRQALDAAFAHNLAARKPARASNSRGPDPAYAPAQALDEDRTTYWAVDDGVTNAWLEVDLGQPTTFNRSVLQEYIELGQRVAEFNLEGWQQGGWQSIAKGTTIGYKRILRFPETTTSKVRLTIQKARACPALSTFALYRAGQI